jgi:hypothetical protein
LIALFFTHLKPSLPSLPPVLFASDANEKTRALLSFDESRKRGHARASERVEEKRRESDVSLCFFLEEEE